MIRRPKQHEPHADQAQSLWWGTTPEVRDAWVLRIILWVAIAAELSALVMSMGAVARIAVGVTALIPLMWIPAQIERLYLAEAQRRPTPRVRRFLRLRSLTEVVLAEIRRMNWLGFDIQRGARDRAAAEMEMAAIELRLRSLVSDIRQAAGVEAPLEPELAPPLRPEPEPTIRMPLTTTVN